MCACTYMLNNRPHEAETITLFCQATSTWLRAPWEAQARGLIFCIKRVGKTREEVDSWSM